MARVISIWLPFWKTDRLERQGGGVRLHEPAPLAVIAKGKGGKAPARPQRQEAELRIGMLLTDACAIPVNRRRTARNTTPRIASHRSSAKALIEIYHMRDAFPLIGHKSVMEAIMIAPA